MKTILIFMYKIKTTIKFILRFINNLKKTYNIVLIDKDDKRNKRLIRDLFKQDKNIKEIHVYETKKGFHYHIYYNNEISFLRVIKTMKYLKTDKSYIKRFELRGNMTLFNSRRGQHNKKYIYNLCR